MSDSSVQATASALLELLHEGLALLAGLHRLEEDMQEQLIQGRFRELAAGEKTRGEWQFLLASLEERLRSVVPPGMVLRDCMAQLAGLPAGAKSEPEREGSGAGRDAPADLFNHLRARLVQVRALQEVNRALLQERLRFSREMQALLLGRELYDVRGQVPPSAAECAAALDRSC